MQFGSTDISSPMIAINLKFHNFDPSQFQPLFNDVLHGFILHESQRWLKRKLFKNFEEVLEYFI